MVDVILEQCQRSSHRFTSLRPSHHAYLEGCALPGEEVTKYRRSGRRSDMRFDQFLETQENGHTDITDIHRFCHIISQFHTVSIDFHLPYATICHEACLVQDSSGWPSPGLRHLGALGFVRWMRNKKSAEVPLVSWEYSAVVYQIRINLGFDTDLCWYVIIPHELRCTVMVMVDQCWWVFRQSSERPTSSALFRWM